MLPEINFGMSGLFRVRVLKDGICKSDSGFFNNLITNGGLDRYGAGQDTWHICRVGSGNTTPAVTDNNLVSQIGSTTSKTSTAGLDTVGGYGWRRNVWTFPVGGATGNIAELATSWLPSGTGIFSRALVRDSGGTPTTITVLADEQLEVTWELRFYWPTTDATGSILNTGNKGGSYDWIGRAADVSGTGGFGVIWQPREDGGSSGLLATLGGSIPAIYYGGNLGTINALPTGTRSTVGSSSVSSYVAGTYRREITYSLSLTQGNIAGGVKSVVIAANGSGFIFQLSFTPAIEKTADDTVSMRFYVSWGRRP